MSMEPFMKKAVKVALGEGASEVEAFSTRSRTISVYLDDDKVKNVEEKQDQGLAIRVIKAKKIGQSSTTINSIRDAERCAIDAVKMASVSGPDPVFKGFPSGSRGNQVPNNYDKDLAMMSVSELAEMAVEIVASAIEDGSVKVPNGVIRASVMQHMVLNTNGAETDQRNTMLYAHVTSMTKGTEPGEGIFSAFTPHRERFDPSLAGRTLAKRAVDAQKAEHFKGSGKMTVIIPPDELSGMLMSTAAYALSAENVHKKRSIWANRQGEQIASSKLTIVDDPFDERGMCSCSFDDEGTKTAVRPLVERGMLKGFMYDHYNALLEGVESTGNALRRVPSEAQSIYRMGVGISPVNFVIEPGSKTLEQMIGEVENGIMIQKIASNDANSITGAFGFEIRCAYVIRNGDVKGTIDHALLTGNMFEALRSVKEIANDATVSGSCILPSIAFEGFEVIGQ
jgi:PmbA protein